MNIQAIIKEAKTAGEIAATAFNIEYRERNGDRLDYGCCGYAVIQVMFGRSRKLKQEFFDSGITSENDSWECYGRSAYKILSSKGEQAVNVQGADYNQENTRAYYRAFKEVFERYGVKVEFNLYQWID